MISEHQPPRRITPGMTETATADSSYMQWGAKIAGSVLMLAFSFLLISFGASLGLSLTSPYRGDGVSGAWLVVVAGIWFAWVMVSGFAAGGIPCRAHAPPCRCIRHSKSGPKDSAKCDAMVGLIEEADGLMAEIEDTGTMDAALMSLAQAVEHYEIARYGTLVAWATQLGHPQAAKLLKETLKEEYGADKALSQLAEDRLNAAA